MGRTDGTPTIADPRSDARVVDARFHDHGSIVILEGRTLRCREWMAAHVASDETILWDSHVVCEPRYVQALYEGMREEGFTVDLW